MRMERDEGRRPIRSVRDGSNEIRVGLDEHVPVPDGPDVFQILVTEFRRVGGTGPVERNSYGLALVDEDEVERPVSSKKVKCSTALPLALTA